MLKTMLCAIGLVFALVLATPATAQTMFRPVAVVNDSAITGFDLAQRAQIMTALGFQAAGPDALRAEALDILVEDRLKLQEGRRLSLTASPENIDDGIGELAKRAGRSADEFKATLFKQGVTEQALQDMVGSEIVWRQVVRARFSRRVEPGEAEIDAEIAELEAKAELNAGSLDAKRYIYRRLKWWRRYRTAVVEVAVPSVPWPPRLRNPGPPARCTPGSPRPG